MERFLSTKEIRSMVKNRSINNRTERDIRQFDRRKRDRRIAINSCIDPCMDRRMFQRRGTFKWRRRRTNYDPRLHKHN